MRSFYSHLVTSSFMYRRHVPYFTVCNCDYKCRAWVSATIWRFVNRRQSPRGQCKSHHENHMGCDYTRQVAKIETEGADVPGFFPTNKHINSGPWWGHFGYRREAGCCGQWWMSHLQPAAANGCNTSGSSSVLLRSRWKAPLSLNRLLPPEQLTSPHRRCVECR